MFRIYRAAFGVCLLALIGCAVLMTEPSRPPETGVEKLPNGDYRVSPEWMAQNDAYEQWLTGQVQDYEDRCCDCHAADNTHGGQCESDLF